MADSLVFLMNCFSNSTLFKQLVVLDPILLSEFYWFGKGFVENLLNNLSPFFRMAEYPFILWLLLRRNFNCQPMGNYFLNSLRIKFLEPSFSRLYLLYKTSNGKKTCIGVAWKLLQPFDNSSFPIPLCGRPP